MRKKVTKVAHSFSGVGYDYTLECGHVIAGVDLRRWRNGVLKEPKNAHCDECKALEEPDQ